MFCEVYKYSFEIPMYNTKNRSTVLTQECLGDVVGIEPSISILPSSLIYSSIYDLGGLGGKALAQFIYYRYDNDFIILNRLMHNT